MSSSTVEQNFIKWCNSLSPDINPYIFIHRYNRYYEEYLPLLKDIFTELHQYVHNQKPNSHSSLKGRIKSKRSFFIKTFIHIADNIKNIFDNTIDIDKRNKTFDKYFKFLLKSNPDKYEKIKKLAFDITPNFDDYSKIFSIIFNELSQEEKDNLITRLGRTEDTYAYRFIIQSIDFPIKSITHFPNGQFYIIDPDGNKIPINKAVRLNPKTDIFYDEKTGITYVTLNGKKEPLNEKNLLYPNNLPANKHTLQNAKKDENGNLILLYDSLILDDNTSLDIIDIKLNPQDNTIYVTDSNGDIRNLNNLLAKSSLKLSKYDDQYLIPDLYDSFNITQDFFVKNHICPIKSRYKDYIASPKSETFYRSIHSSVFHQNYGFTAEGQFRTQEMEDKAKDESTRGGHDAYKQSKSKEISDNLILSKILAEDPLAFDSSSPTLMKLIEDNNVDLSELLGRYLLTTTVSDGTSITYEAPINVIFEHTFHNVPSQSNLSNNSMPRLDFSSYNNFISSKKSRNDYINESSDYLEIYDE